MICQNPVLLLLLLFELLYLLMIHFYLLVVDKNLYFKYKMKYSPNYSTISLCID